MGVDWGGTDAAAAAAETYKDDPDHVALKTQLETAYEKIHSFGTAVEDAKRYGTADDCKSVGGSWPAAHAAYESLPELAARIPDYVVGNALAGEKFPETEMPADIGRLRSRYREAADDAISDVSIHARDTHRISVRGIAAEVAEHSDDYDAAHFQAREDADTVEKAANILDR